MENLGFILWLCLFPLTISIGEYFNAKKRKMLNKEEYSDTANAYTSLVMIIIWLVVASMLYVP